MNLLRPLVVAAILHAAASPRSVAAQAARAADVMTLESFTARVRASHPVIRQAHLGVDAARDEQRVARGAFDPTVSAQWDRKSFGTVSYYDYLTAALTVPTPLGADVKLGFERTGGVYANPDRRTPSRGLVTAGLSIPLGQRMLTDERRTAVVVARALRDGAVADRDATVNRVLLVATRDYARWFEAERRVAIAGEGMALAEFRLTAVRRRVQNGEAAALDTVEAALEVVRRDVQRVEASQARFAARLAAEQHLWDSRGLPDSLPASVMPSATSAHLAPRDLAAVEALVVAAQRAHPEMGRADARVLQAAALQRLAAQQRMPFVSADVGALDAPGNGVPNLSPLDDAKLGLTFRSPLLFLRERGRAAAAGARVDQGAIDRDRARREVRVLVQTAAAEVETADRALALQRTVIDYARALVRGEQVRFDAGEGTLFLVNLRERALLDEELRQASLEARQLIAQGELAAATGVWLGSRPPE